MKIGQIDKLYSKLSAQQQANLLFSAVAQGNANEADAIESSVEQNTYRMADLEFHRQLLQLQHVVGTYSREYWRLRALMMYHVSNDEADLSTTKQFIDNLLALEQALVDVCKQLNVDFTSVKKLALCLDIDDITPETTLPVADDELVANFTQLMMLK